MVGVVGSSPIAPTSFLTSRQLLTHPKSYRVRTWRLFRFGGRLRVVGHMLNHVIPGIDHH